MEINELFIFSCWKVFLFKISIKLTSSNLFIKLYHFVFCLKYILSHVILSPFLRVVAVQTSVKCDCILPSCKE